MKQDSVGNESVNSSSNSCCSQSVMECLISGRSFGQFYGSCPSMNQSIPFFLSVNRLLRLYFESPSGFIALCIRNRDFKTSLYMK